MFQIFSSGARFRVVLAAIVLLPFGLTVHASPDLKELADDPYWLALLHMEPRSAGSSVSFVDDRDFFLANDGQSNAYAELQATLEAFQKQPEIRCKYVARWQWLEVVGSQYLPKVDPECRDYDTWRAKMNTHKVVLVFASSYLNSPSSMYGHTFLRLDAPDMENNSPLLSYALNFGAIVNESDNGMLYAFRGLIGGYPGQFSSQAYYEKVKEYSRIDNRDLWEYHLNLNSDEIDKMLAHIWELNFVNFDYYFFDENCSLRLLELLDVARPGHNLGQKFPVVAVPIDTVRAVQDAGMIDDVHYRASNATRQGFQNDHLTVNGRKLTQQLVSDEMILTSNAYRSESVEQRQTIVEVAYNHLKSLQDKTAGRDEVIAKRRYALLKERHALAVQKSMQKPRIPVPIAPDQGHETRVWGVRVGEVDGEVFVDLDARIAYHDLLDNLAGYSPSSTLAMGRLVLRAQKRESLSIEAFELINIMSLTSGNQLHQPLSWQVNSGGQRIRSGESDAWSSFVNGGVGHTYDLSNDLKGYGLIRAQVEYSDLYDDHWDMAAGATFGLLFQSSRHNLTASLTHWEFASSRERQQFKLGYQYAIEKNVGVRVEWTQTREDGDGYRELSLSARHYF